MQMNAIEEFKLPAGKKTELKDYDPSWVPEWAAAKEEKGGKKAVKKNALDILEKNKKKLAAGLKKLGVLK